VPHTTFAFGFEWKMLEGAVGLAVAHGGSDLTKMLKFLPDGPVELERRLEDHARERPHLFYDPFDPPEYRWLAWKGLSRAAAEELLGIRFEGRDFVSFRDRTEIEFPEEWGVMF
jgi:hypothetical protein